MHKFDNLLYRGTSFTLKTLNELIPSLQINGSTNDVMNLQMIQLQKSILAIGMFSLFESILQKGLSCEYGFKKTKEILNRIGKIELHDRFNDFICAINVLKHGQGNSYNILISKSESLPFKVRLPTQSFFNEGDVCEISTLIEVDDIFVLNCVELIELVLKEIRNEYPESYL